MGFTLLDRLNLTEKIKNKLELFKANTISEKEQIYSFILKAQHSLDPKELASLLLAIKEFNKLNPINLSFSNSKILYETSINLDDIDFYAYFYDLQIYFDEKISMSNLIVEKEKNKFILFCSNEETFNLVKKNEKKFNIIFKNFVGLEESIVFKLDEEKFNIGKFKTFMSTKEKELEKDQIKVFGKKALKPGYISVNPRELANEIPKAYFEGEIFKVEIRETNRGSYQAKIGIVNAKDISLMATYFTSNLEKLSKFEEKVFVRVYGGMKFNVRSQSYELKIDNIEFLPNEKKKLLKSKSPNTRVELHTHTQMSQMDGVGKVEDYFESFSMSGLNLRENIHEP